MGAYIWGEHPKSVSRGGGLLLWRANPKKSISFKVRRLLQERECKRDLATTNYQQMRNEERRKGL